MYTQVNFNYRKNLVYFTFLKMHTKSAQIQHKSRNQKAPGSNAIVTVDSKVRISNQKDQLYSQLVKFIKLTIEMIKKKI